jgi:hypothetical protein
MHQIPFLKNIFQVRKNIILNGTVFDFAPLQCAGSFENLIFLMQIYWEIYQTLWEFGGTTFPYVDDDFCFSLQRHGKKSST